MISILTLPRTIREELFHHANEAAPEECCGVLLGRSAAGISEILEAVPIRNVASDPVRLFQIDPKGHFEAIRLARTRGVEIVGAYHSHPRGEAVPSETDRALAFEDDGFTHVLIAPHRAEISAYVLVRGDFVAVPIATTGPNRYLRSPGERE